MTMKKLSTGGRARVRGLDVDGNLKIPVRALRPRVRVREGLQCSWREACKAADYVLENFGNRRRDRGIWVWYCQRLGLGTFLDLADEIISSWKQQEIRWPVRAFQRHLMDALPKEAAR